MGVCTSVVSMIADDVLDVLADELMEFGRIIRLIRHAESGHCHLSKDALG